MPLPTPAARERLHTRTVECQGFRRDDGLWDIDAQLVDTKSYPFPNRFRGEIQAGEPLHNLFLRLTVDDHFVVREIAVSTDDAPFAVCPDILPNFQRLVGLQITNGWTRAIRERLGGVEGCTHLVELLGPVATTAFQTIFSAKHHEAEKQGKVIQYHKKPALLDTCHALSSDGDVVREHWPQFYTGDMKDAS